MSRDFKKEIDLLDETYTDIVEAIMNKPEVEDYERSRIYFENVVAHMNNWIENIKEVKNSLEKREPVKDLTADNRPA
ncbi:MAG: hypothetical protein K8F60_11355 [Melioribacteraceae bacterium]|jgi:pantoate kinase|nr:hypothetical protein [Ignavibacteriota bacterium]MBZ0183044.1 hypothetical protein [Melioribacteraceae bacterium]